MQKQQVKAESELGASIALLPSGTGRPVLGRLTHDDRAMCKWCRATGDIATCCL